MLAIINNQTNICENVSTDPRPASEIEIPGYTVLNLSEIPSVGWEWDTTTKEWVMVDEGLGQGGIGNTYENGKLIEPKPTYPGEITQPTTIGTEEV